jgi:flagellar motor switch protein FliN
MSDDMTDNVTDDVTDDATSSPASSSSANASPEAVGFVGIWVDSLTRGLGQIGGSPLPCLALPQPPAEAPAAGAADLWVVCACSGGLRGEMSLRLPPATTLRFAQMFMSEPPMPEAELTADHREAVVELARQIGGLVASELKPAWGEVQLRFDAPPGAPSWPASSAHWIGAGEDPATASLLEVQLSAALVAGLRVEKTEAAKAAPLPASPSPPAPPTPPVPPTADESNAKLALLMDVELAITLRFGSRRLLLREVLDLNPGAVIDLDRLVQDPVDLLLDGRLVARGEVVVLDGNYGVRVTEVAPANP